MAKIFPRQGDETFVIRGLVQFNITAAKQMIQENPREPVMVDVKMFRNYISGRESLVLGITVRPDIVEKANPDVPGIMANFQFHDGQFYDFPIDGWHRLAKSDKEGRETMAFYPLTQEEIAQIMFR
jgi:hypothetical protein